MEITDSVTTQVRRPRRRRATVLSLLVLVALSAFAFRTYRNRVLVKSRQARPALIAVFRRNSPTADGIIGAKEYGEGLPVTWTAGNTLAAFQHEFYSPTDSSVRQNATKNKGARDLSLIVHAAYTNKSLFLAFHVHDQFIDAQEVDGETPNQNDGVEVFIDGDGVPNDFGLGRKADGTLYTVGSKEGFQLLVDAAGHQLTAAQDFKDSDWKRAVRRTAEGYIVEIEIPLALIDTKDGVPYASPVQGSSLNFAFAVTDNDAEVREQTTYAYLQTPRTNMAPWLGREPAWNFAIELEPEWSLPSW